MPTQSTTYNSRVTDEALEKRFRDTFRAQGGAELVDDLYAQGVIVPIVDFTAAATGTVLAQNLQTAWDFTTGHVSVPNSGVATNIITGQTGFWQLSIGFATQDAAGDTDCLLRINDGLGSKTFWAVDGDAGGTATGNALTYVVVFLRAGDSVQGLCQNNATLRVSYRQIATSSGDLVDPSGFTSS